MVETLPLYVEKNIRDIQGPIRAYFTFNELPEESDLHNEHSVVTPDWLGIPLPIRAFNLGVGAALLDKRLPEALDTLDQTDGDIPIFGIDAMYALGEAKKENAAAALALHSSHIYYFPAHSGILEPTPQLLSIAS